MNVYNLYDIRNQVLDVLSVYCCQIISFFIFLKVGVCIFAKSTVFTISILFAFNRTYQFQIQSVIISPPYHLHSKYFNSKDVKGTHTRYSNKIILFIFLQHHRSFQLHFTDFWTSYLSIMWLYHYSKPLQLYTTARLLWKVYNLLDRKRNMNLQISASSLVTKQRFPTTKDTMSLK